MSCETIFQRRPATTTWPRRSLNVWRLRGGPGPHDLPKLEKISVLALTIREHLVANDPDPSNR